MNTLVLRTGSVALAAAGLGIVLLNAPTMTGAVIGAAHGEPAWLGSAMLLVGTAGLIKSRHEALDPSMRELIHLGEKLADRSEYTKVVAANASAIRSEARARAKRADEWLRTGVKSATSTPWEIYERFRGTKNQKSTATHIANTLGDLLSLAETVSMERKELVNKRYDLRTFELRVGSEAERLAKTLTNPKHRRKLFEEANKYTERATNYQAAFATGVINGLRYQKLRD